MTTKNNAREILPTNNPSWGLWGTAASNGMDVQRVWEVTSRHYAETYSLEPIDTRNLLDSRFGRHLADALVDTAATIETNLKAIDAKWGKWVRQAIAEAKANRDSF